CVHPRCELSLGMHVVKRAEYHDRCVEEVKQHQSTSTKIVQSLRRYRVSRMKYRTEEPGDHAHIRSEYEDCPGRVRGREFLLYEIQATVELDTVQDGEYYRERLLNAQDTIKGPFPVELLDTLSILHS